MKIIKVWLLIFFSLILIILDGCSLINPTYVKPNVEVADNWAYINESITYESNFPYLAWWEQFNDPQLNHLIKQGLQVNNSVQKAFAHLEIAQGQLRAVNLSWIPGINLYAGYSTNPALGYPNYFYGAWPSYSALNIFNLISQHKAATLNVEAQQYAVSAARLTFIAQFTTGYFTYLAESERLELVDNYLADLSEWESIKNADFQRGLVPAQNVDEIQQRLWELRAQRELIVVNIQKAQNALQYLLNQNPGPLMINVHFESFCTQFPDVGAQPVTVLNNRPDVELAETELRLATQNSGVIASQLLPAVQLDYFAGQSDVDAKGPDGIYTPTTDAYLTWSVNPAIFGEIKSFSGAKKFAYANYLEVVRGALRDVDNDLVNHRDSNHRYELINKAYLTALDKYQLNNALYKKGIIAYNDIMVDKLNVDQAKIALNQIKLLQMTTLISLYQDLGGGYNSISLRSN